MATVQVRNISDGAYEVLKRRAQRGGRSLQEYLRLTLEDLAARQTTAEVIGRVRVDMAWTDVDDGPSMDEIVELIRSGRDR